MGLFSISLTRLVHSRFFTWTGRVGGGGEGEGEGWEVELAMLVFCDVCPVIACLASEIPQDKGH